jgi:hypothetical protein
MPLTPVRTLRIPGRYAMSFDGVDDYVRVPDSASLRSPTDAITVMLWFKMPRQNAEQLIGKWSTDWSTFFDGWRILMGINGKFEFHFSDHSFPWTRIVASGTYGSNIWTNIAVTYDRIKLRTFIDGVLDNERAENRAIYPSIQPLMFNAPWYKLAGLIGEALVYNRALSSTEISWNYNNFSNPVRAGLVLSLIAHPDYIRDIDNDGILEWIDLSGLGNHGKIFGATLVDLFKTPVRTLQAVRTLPVAR